MTTSILAVALMAIVAGSTDVAPDDTTVVLQGVTVSGQRQRDFQMRSSQSAVQISHDYLQQHFSGSLMQTLEGIPGVKAMAIGSGQSKPTIRGLGYNRMVVSEDGIKHEGQQWGDDHGLEIDQFAVDRAEVIKGPAALLYGSDAIGGVLSLYTNHIPTQPLSGSVQLFGRSNNEQLGVTSKLGGRHGNWFYRVGATLIDYADYRVPTDSIQYYSYWIRLKDQRLRNTAGCERDGSVVLGYAGYRFHTDLRRPALPMGEPPESAQPHLISGRRPACGSQLCLAEQPSRGTERACESWLHAQARRYVGTPFRKEYADGQSGHDAESGRAPRVERGYER